MITIMIFVLLLHTLPVLLGILIYVFLSKREYYGFWGLLTVSRDINPLQYWTSMALVMLLETFIVVIVFYLDVKFIGK